MNKDITCKVLEIGQKDVVTNSEVNLQVLDNEEEQNPLPYVEPKNNMVQLKESCQKYDGDFKIPLKDSLIINSAKKTKFHQHICEISNISSSDNKMLIEETYVRVEERLYKCNVCKKSFSHLSRLTKHVLIHNSTSTHPSTCEVCKKSVSYKKRKIPQKNELVNRQNILKGKKHFTCENCGKSSHKHSTEKTSVNKDFSLSNYKTYDKTFPISSNLKTQPQKDSAERPFTCEICAKSFSFQTSFDRHKLMHSGKTPYACEVCKKSYFEKRDLIYHLNIHITGHS